ncbi:GtrA family protein [Streptomyces sp. NPDC048664]|uniref:GtrA family protein n=1 Tax=Streptomyces sp. NPDC048664 TaxID=3154505 RepID=UPI003416387B
MNARAVRQFTVFAVVGLANTAVYYAVYVTADRRLPYLAAHVLGYAVSLVCSFLLNSAVTLRVRPTWHAFARYPLSGATNVVASGILLHLAVSQLGVDEHWAALGAGVLVTPLSFLLARWALTSGARGTGPAAATRLPAAAGERTRDLERRLLRHR